MAVRYEPVSGSAPKSGNLADCLSRISLFSLKRLLIFLFCFSGFAIFWTSVQLPSLSESDPPTRHPIPGLILEAEQRWDELRSGQSKTYEELIQKYRARYAVRPPRGLDKWWEFAMQNNVTMVDSYDELMSSLEPFREMGSLEMRRRVEILMAGGRDINAIIVQNSTFPTIYAQRGARIERSNGILNMLKPVENIISELNMDEWMIPVNELAEPRVLNTEDITDKEYTIMDKRLLRDELWQSHSYGEPSLIESIKTVCGLNSSFTRENTTFRIQGDKNLIPTTAYGKSFITNLESLTSDMDICSRPELTQYHSVFRTRHYTTRGLFPMLSFGKPSAYSEIVVPTHYQFDENDAYSLDENTDLPFDEKIAKVFWHGSPTGGGNGDTSFGSMHRHRVIRFFSLSNNSSYFTGASPPPENYITTYTSRIPFPDQTNMTFVMPNKGDCWFYNCKNIATYPTLPTFPLNETWKYQYLADLDGWGYSARFRGLIQSNSAVFKSTIYKEWWTERAVPWIHYVPVSLSGADWADVVTYFLGIPNDGFGHSVRTASALRASPHPDDGKKIADAGALWAREHMRQADMTAYVLRVFIELNRLFNDNYLPGTDASMAKAEREQIRGELKKRDGWIREEPEKAKAEVNVAEEVEKEETEGKKEKEEKKLVAEKMEQAENEEEAERSGSISTSTFDMPTIATPITQTPYA